MYNRKYLCIDFRAYCEGLEKIGNPKNIKAYDEGNLLIIQDTDDKYYLYNMEFHKIVKQFDFKELTHMYGDVYSAEYSSGCKLFSSSTMKNISDTYYKQIYPTHEDGHILTLVSNYDGINYYDAKNKRQLFDISVEKVLSNGRYSIVRSFGLYIIVDLNTGQIKHTPFDSTRSKYVFLGFEGTQSLTAVKIEGLSRTQLYNMELNKDITSVPIKYPIIKKIKHMANEIYFIETDEHVVIYDMVTNKELFYCEGSGTAVDERLVTIFDGSKNMYYTYDIKTRDMKHAHLCMTLTKDCYLFWNDNNMPEQILVNLNYPNDERIISKDSRVGYLNGTNVLYIKDKRTCTFIDALTMKTILQSIPLEEIDFICKYKKGIYMLPTEEYVIYCEFVEKTSGEEKGITCRRYQDIIMTDLIKSPEETGLSAIVMVGENCNKVVFRGKMKNADAAYKRFIHKIALKYLTLHYGKLCAE